LDSLENEEMVIVPKKEVDVSEEEIIVLSSSDEEENVQNENPEEARTSKAAMEKDRASIKVLATRNV
jgi:hypothetical protein